MFCYFASLFCPFFWLGFPSFCAIPALDVCELLCVFFFLRCWLKNKFTGARSVNVGETRRRPRGWMVAVYPLYRRRREGCQGSNAPSTPSRWKQYPSFLMLLFLLYRAFFRLGKWNDQQLSIDTPPADPLINSLFLDKKSLICMLWLAPFTRQERRLTNHSSQAV